MSLSKMTTHTQKKNCHIHPQDPNPSKLISTVPVLVIQYSIHLTYLTKIEIMFNEHYFRLYTITLGIYISIPKEKKKADREKKKINLILSN